LVSLSYQPEPEPELHDLVRCSGNVSAPRRCTWGARASTSSVHVGRAGCSGATFPNGRSDVSHLGCWAGYFGMLGGCFGMLGWFICPSTTAGSRHFGSGLVGLTGLVLWLVGLVGAGWGTGALAMYVATIQHQAVPSCPRTLAIRPSVLLSVFFTYTGCLT
jgi:hypothetical protein